MIVQIFGEPTFFHFLMSGVRTLLHELLVPFKGLFKVHLPNRVARDSGKDRGTKELGGLCQGDRSWLTTFGGALVTSRKHSSLALGVAFSVSLSLPPSLPVSSSLSYCGKLCTP